MKRKRSLPEFMECGDWSHLYQACDIPDSAGDRARGISSEFSLLFTAMRRKRRILTYTDKKMERMVI